MTDIENAKAALTALGNPRGAPELQSILAHLERDIEDACAAARSACQATSDLPAFHTALVRCHRLFDPIHEAILEYEDYADALYWARKATHTESQIVLAVVRAYKHLLQDLKFGLPLDCYASKHWLRGQTQPRLIG